MYLLDSNALYWWMTDSRSLSRSARDILEDGAVAVYYSVIASWELAIKNGKGKLPLPKHFFPKIPKLGFVCLPVDESHIGALRELPRLHGDPFDRMLAAQAKAEKMTLVTSDKKLADYPIKTLLI